VHVHVVALHEHEPEQKSADALPLVPPHAAESASADAIAEMDARSKDR
jgi:hypothetical protein